jgi:hypothetical protein
MPKFVDLGVVPAGAPSVPYALTLVNDGNAPLAIADRQPTQPSVRMDLGCEPGTSVPPGGRCAVQLTVNAAAAGPGGFQMLFTTSDGPYLVNLGYTAAANGPGPGPGPGPGGTVDLIEYFHAAFGHYFVTSIAGEIAALDNGTIPGWQRTGRMVRAWSQPPGQPATVPVCRFFSARFAPRSSHFYSASAAECDGLRRGTDWQFEGDVFHVALPDAAAACPAGTQPVYRLYNNAASGAPNHRFTTDAALRATMVGQGWTPEGAGAGVTMCTPQ